MSKQDKTRKRVQDLFNAFLNDYNCNIYEIYEVLNYLADKNIDLSFVKTTGFKCDGLNLFMKNIGVKRTQYSEHLGILMLLVISRHSANKNYSNDKLFNDMKDFYQCYKDFHNHKMNDELFNYQLSYYMTVMALDSDRMYDKCFDKDIKIDKCNANKCEGSVNGVKFSFEKTSNGKVHISYNYKYGNLKNGDLDKLTNFLTQSV